MDIIIPTIRNLDFLEEWRAFFKDHHLIIIQDGDPNRVIKIPEGFDYEIYNWNDIQKELGEDRWIISKRDSACRCFGFLKSKSRYVFTIDDDCFPAKNPFGKYDDVIKMHQANLDSRSFTNYFNTLYNQEFVRGFPFSRRIGSQTAISHGLWLNVPDFDAPTQMVRPNYRNDMYFDLVIDVPDKVLYSMCGMNLAFNNELIGPAMYFGLMGDGQPLGRYDDMWAGWCSKVICDHLGYGVKTGKPYIWHQKASDWKSNLKKEMNGIIWQDDIISFFERFKFSDSARNASQCYLELADGVEKELGKIDPYFLRLSSAMKIWIKLWKERKKTV